MFTANRLSGLLLCMVIMHVSESSFATCNGTIPCTCTIAASTMNFGSYTFTTATPTNGSGSVTVTCTSGPLLPLSASYTLSASLTTAGNSQRSMTGPLSSQLLYNLYTNGGRTIIWGDGTVGTVTIPDSCSQNCPGVCGARSCNRTTNVFGAIPAGQAVRAGSYSSVLTITVTY